MVPGNNKKGFWYAAARNVE